MESEAYILFMLKGFGIPNLISYGKSGKYNILVEELLGPSLNDILKLRKIKNGFPIKDICMIAIQGLDRLEFIHSKNIIHRDIKPHNFLIGKKNESIIYLIDFGFARKYKSSRTGKFIKFTNLGKLFGSMAFSSINANSGYEQSRRDDLESFGYMLIYLAKKNLPWMDIGIMKNKREEVNEVCKIKKHIKIEKICEGLPEEFIYYIKYCRKLKFEIKPNYDYLRNLFTLILMKENQKNDLQFFWINKRNANSAKKNYENYQIMKAGTHKRLYTSVKNSLEKKRSGEINTLKSNNSKDKDSLEKINDILKNKKEIQNKNRIYINLEKKSLNDKTKVSIKHSITDNIISAKPSKIFRIKEKNLYKNLKINDSSYYSKNQNKILKVMIQKKISDYSGLKNSSNVSNQNLNNIIIENYFNFHNTVNNYHIKKVNINNISKTNYYNKYTKQIPYHNFTNKINSDINYKPKFKNLGNKNKTDFSLLNDKNNSIRVHDNKTKLENYTAYTCKRDKKNSRVHAYKNIFGNYTSFTFQNDKKYF